jgi:hypothetical protein
MTATINLMAAPKGGLGKTFITSLIAQAYRRRGRVDELVLVDSDTNNASLSRITELGARRVALFRENDLEKTLLDPLINEMLGDGKTYLIDTGGAAFRALTGYISMLDLASAFAESGKRLVAHTIVVGGGAMMDSIAGFVEVMKWLPRTADSVLWMNEHEGPAAACGTHFLEGELFAQYQSRVFAIGHLPRLDSAYRGTTETLVNSRMTIDAALEELKNDPTRRLEFRKLSSVAHMLFEAVEPVVFRTAKAA